MKRASVVFFLAIAAAAPARAETSAEGDEDFGRYLFPPEMVMGHAQAIGLDEVQRKALREEVQKAQSKFLDAQFQLKEEQETMTRLLQERPVDEAKVLSEVDRILAVEKEIKRTQIGLLVRIKNLLTPAQQARLTEIRKGDAR